MYTVSISLISSFSSMIIQAAVFWVHQDQSFPCYSVLTMQDIVHHPFLWQPKVIKTIQNKNPTKGWGQKPDELARASARLQHKFKTYLIAHSKFVIFSANICIAYWTFSFLISPTTITNSINMAVGAFKPMSWKILKFSKNRLTLS